MSLINNWITQKRAQLEEPNAQDTLWNNLLGLLLGVPGKVNVGAAAPAKGEQTFDEGPPRSRDNGALAHAQALASLTPTPSPTLPRYVPEQYRDLIYGASQKYELDPAILASLLNTESHFNPHARSGKGAVGVGQFMPQTAQALGIDPNDPTQAIEGAAHYLRQNLDQFGDIQQAVAAYNAGAGNVRRYKGIPPFPETQAYVKKVLGGAQEE